MLALDFVGDARGHDSPSLSSLSAIALPVLLLQLQSRLPCPPSPPLRAAVQEVLSSLLLQDGAAEQGNAPVPEPLGGSVQEVLLLEDRACLPCKACAGLSEAAGAAGGDQEVQEDAGASWGLHLACTDSSCPGTSNPLLVIPPSVCATDTGCQGNAGGNSPSAFACVMHRDGTALA